MVLVAKICPFYVLHHVHVLGRVFPQVSFKFKHVKRRMKIVEPRKCGLILQVVFK